MLGNLKPYLPALSRESKDIYTSYYCGLCKQLGKEYGPGARFLLNYDSVLIAMIYDGLKSESPLPRPYRCLNNRLKKQEIFTSPGISYSADVLILLSYYKLLDDLRDEKFIKKLLLFILKPYLKSKFRKAAKKLPHLREIFRLENEKQVQAEKTSSDIDILCMSTAGMTRRIISDCRPREDISVKQFGACLGRVIYLLDALLDRERDKKEGKFNIFNIQNTPDSDAASECLMALGETAHWYSHLSVGMCKKTIDNIIYISIRRAILQSAGQGENK